MQLSDAAEGVTASCLSLEASKSCTSGIKNPTGTTGYVQVASMDELHNAGMMKNNNASNNNNNDNTNQAIIILLIKYGLSLSSNQIIFLDSCTFSKRALQQLLPAEDEGT